MTQDQGASETDVAHLRIEAVKAPPEPCSMIGAAIDMNDRGKAAKQKGWQVSLESEDGANHKELSTTVADRNALFRVHEELFRAVKVCNCP